MILEDMGILENHDTKFIMELLSKYEIVSFHNDKCFELSVTFAAILQSNMEKYNPLLATLFAVKSYAEGATDAERAVMSTHILLNVISDKQKMEIMRIMIPMMDMMPSNSDFEPGFFSKMIEKIKDTE